MTHLARGEMAGLTGEGGTGCGIGFGALIAASMMWGAVGFAMVVNKTAVLCALEPWY